MTSFCTPQHDLEHLAKAGERLQGAPDRAYSDLGLACHPRQPVVEYARG